MALVTFTGTGQLNGIVNINTTIEVNETTVKNLGGQNRSQVKKAIVEREYPGVKIDPNNISWRIVKESNKKVKSETSVQSKSVKNNPKSKPFSIGNVFMWILFFPFKLVWWLIKNLAKDTWRNDHLDTSNDRKWDKFNYKYR